MSNRLLKTVTLLAFTALSTVALADDPPARVGRVALTQGQVSISGDAGTPAAGVQVNWPVTSHNRISTARGARTELRIGSTSVRLDGDSALEVTELDDDNLRLRLHYGSASVRIVNADVLAGFELVTPQARVRMQQPGRIRVDAEREQDTSTVQVFDGVAQVEGGGAELALRAGRSAEVQGADVRTAQATRDAFDDWSFGRDQYQDRSQATRYVPPEMTGYEDLDRYGSWRSDAEYGALWLPSVGPDWVPYRDGSWTWIDPWGWTWVDNAPWGYAPFHYGRWVHVNHRWAWAPGRHDRHPVWAPALVGWVGGAGWNMAFRDKHGQRPVPAQGWYPLSPYDRFVPSYRAPEGHLRWWNRNLRPDDRRTRDRNHRPEGLTVVPHDAFGHRDRVDVPRVPKGAPAPGGSAVAPGSAPPPPLAHERGDHRREDGRGRFERGDGARRGERTPVLTAPPMMEAQPQARQPGTVLTAPPAPAAAAPAPQLQNSPWRDRHQGREVFEDGRRRRDRSPAPLEAGGLPAGRADVVPAPGTNIASPPMQQGPAPGTSIASPPMQQGPVAGTAIASPPMQQGPAAGTVIASPPMQPSPAPSGFAPRFERPHRGDGESGHRWREQRGLQQPPMAAPAPRTVAPLQAVRPPAPPGQPAPPPVVSHPMAPPPAAAMARPAPPPPPAAAVPAQAQAQAQAAPQGGRSDEHHGGGRERGGRQMER
ncbi:MAG: DUF6600 domain-containing protein [Massilia sp.]